MFNLMKSLKNNLKGKTKKIKMSNINIKSNLQNLLILF